MHPENKINISGLEINISERCNLTCKGCDHGMGVIESKIIPTSKLVLDIKNTAKYFHTNTLRIIGGEPLLHPELSQIIYEFAHIGIANSIELWTNGILIKNVKKGNWHFLDGIVISKYPNVNLKLNNDFLKSLSSRFNIWINLRESGTFSWSISYKKHQYKKAKILHDSCRESSTCNTVRNGKFFKCVQAAFAKDRLRVSDVKFKDDGIKLSGSFEDFFKQYQTYMWSASPINACYYCFGEYGDKFSHELVNEPNNNIKEVGFNNGFIFPK